MFLLALPADNLVYLRPHASLVGERVAQQVQSLTVGLLLWVAGDAVAAPVVAQLAVVLVQRLEVTLHGLGLGVLHLRRGLELADGFIDGGHGFQRIVVVLQLVGSQHLACQFLTVTGCVTQGGGYQFRGLVCADGIADGIVTARIENNFNSQAVVIGGHLVALLILNSLLIQQLNVPTVKAPHQECCRRTAALHLHSLLVAEVRSTASASCCYKVELLTPYANRRGGYLWPFLHLRQRIVVVGYLNIVKVVVVTEQRQQNGFLFLAVHTGGVLVLPLLRDKAHIPLCLVLVELLVKSAGVLRQ